MSQTELKTNVAVVGCGYWGPNLMRNFSEHPRSSLRWLVDLNPQRLAQFQGRYPGIRTTTQLSEALADPDLHAVAIATPVSTSLPFSLEFWTQLQPGSNVDGAGLVALGHATA